ncbi:MAG: hypothetical protein ACLUIX_07395 [Oscillospiraceae bacterium]
MSFFQRVGNAMARFMYAATAEIGWDWSPSGRPLSSTWCVCSSRGIRCRT